MKLFRHRKGKAPLPPLAGPHDFHVEIGNRWYAASQLVTGIATLGVPRTGKTSIIEGIERAFVQNGQGLISVYFDGNKAHRLRSVAPPGYQVHRVDVSTKGGSKIDFRPMWRTQTQRELFAQKVSPVIEGSHNSYFDAAGQEYILAAVSQCMEWGAKTCELADALRLADSPYLLSELGREVPKIGDPSEILGMTSKSARDVRATLRTKLRSLMIYGSLALHATESVNLLGVANGTKPAAACLVFKDTHKHAMEKILSFALDCAIYERLTNGGEDYFLCNFDEVTSLSRLEALVDLIRRGAKRQLVYALSAHSVEGLYKRYGNEDGEDVCSLPAFKVILKLQSKKSASWASDALGVCEVLDNINPRYYWPMNDDKNAKIEGGIRDRANVHWDEIRRLPLASWISNLIEGFIDTPESTRHFRSEFQHLVSTPTPPPVHEPAPAEWEVLPPFDVKDYRRLNIPLELVKRAEDRRQAALDGRDDD